MEHSSLSPFLAQELLGCTQRHLCDLSERLPKQIGVKVHVSLAEPLQQLVDDAKTAGFDLRIASGFRGFERQRLIWNRKCRGEKPVLDAQGDVIDVQSLTPWEKVQAILHWSALPGASRHHWGTECDIFDAAAISEDYQLRLHPDEYQPDGVFGDMMQWLEPYLKKDSSPEFYRPYWEGNNIQTNGVMPEPWHISYRPVAEVYEKQYCPELLARYLRGLPKDKQLAEQATILENIDAIYQQYIKL
jgi:LAS superfamily LD-carboxypeptidase LdcB